MASRVGSKIKLTSIDELLCVPETNGTTEIELGLISAFGLKTKSSLIILSSHLLG